MAEAATADMVCVILAGGRGKRMASAEKHKVCFPIAGRPAIVRAIDTYKAAGLKRFVVVVGQMAEQVISTVAAVHPEVLFVYQAEPRGIGHAAACAVEALASQGYAGNVMVVMGDKATRPDVVRRLLSRFAETSPDILVTALAKDEQTTAGRIVRDSAGRVLGVVETPDIENARAHGTRIRVGGRALTAEEIESASTSVNVSMYAFHFPALEAAIRQLRPDNAQAEFYLTDTVEEIGRRGRCEVLLLSDPQDLMGFNTPAELLAIEEVIRKQERVPRVAVRVQPRLSDRELKPVREWQNVFTGGGELTRFLQQFYGADAELIERQRQQAVRLLEVTASLLGPERPILLCRAPGRVNLMGRHVDHRGGYVNVMAISREVLLAAAPRPDDVVTIRNLDPQRFPDRQFDIFGLLAQESWLDWVDFLATNTAQQVLKTAPGDWSHYARAPLLRLQHECRDARLKGMDCVVSGSIPMGAGLSSSSALVVAFAEAAVAINGLDLTLRDFIDLCGEGEWFVGSRGGSADHAAIRTSKAGVVSRIGFFPFRMEGEVTFPAELDVVIAHSGSQAVKSAGARDVFNQRVASYQVAERLLRKVWPPAAGMQHLRDLVPDRLGVESGDILRALLRLPERPSRRRIRDLLPEAEHQPALDRIFSAHRNLGGYDLRGVTLFGISECVRSGRFAETVRQGDIATIGRFMRASHDGDRVWRHDAAGRARRFLVRTDAGTLERLARGNADLSLQPGRYACSTEAIDRLVDIADATEGVVGAQLAGAGLGGCMMIVVKSSSRDLLMERLRTRFYEPGNVPFGAILCRPVAGAGILAL